MRSDKIKQCKRCAVVINSNSHKYCSTCAKIMKEKGNSRKPMNDMFSWKYILTDKWFRIAVLVVLVMITIAVAIVKIFGGMVLLALFLGYWFGLVEITGNLN